MSDKKGPYGSHYGTGCYTPNCRLRSAAANNVVAPISFEQAQASLSQAYSRVMSSRANKGAEESLKAAKLALNATDEGLKALKTSLAAEKKRSGSDSVAYLSLENELQVAQNEHDLKDAKFRKEVFDSITAPVTANDLKFLAGSCTRYRYDKFRTALVHSSNPKRVFAQLDYNGNLVVFPTGSESKRAYHETPDHYNEVKALISEQVYADALIDIENRPTVNSKIFNTLNARYAGSLKVHADGSYTSIVRSRDSYTPYAQLEFSKENEFKSASWANERNDGSMTWPDSNPFKILSLLRSGEIKNKPVLPSYVSEQK